MAAATMTGAVPTVPAKSDDDDASVRQALRPQSLPRPDRPLHSAPPAPRGASPAKGGSSPRPRAGRDRRHRRDRAATCRHSRPAASPSSNAPRSAASAARCSVCASRRAPGSKPRATSSSPPRPSRSADFSHYYRSEQAQTARSALRFDRPDRPGREPPACPPAAVEPSRSASSTRRSTPSMRPSPAARSR